MKAFFSNLPADAQELFPGQFARFWCDWICGIGLGCQSQAPAHSGTPGIRFRSKQLHFPP